MTDMEKTIRFIILLACLVGCLDLNAQTDVYATRNARPETTALYRNVTGITYQGQQATIYAGGKQQTIDVSELKAMGFTDTDTRRLLLMPEEYRRDFMFDIKFLDSDAALAANAEPLVTDTASAYYDDFVQNSTWDKTVTVTYAAQAVVTGAPEGVTVTVSGNHVTVNSTVAGVEFVLQGTSTDGSFKLYSDKKTKVTLNGLTLTNPKGPAINSQSKKRLFLVINDGTDNTLADGASYTKVSGEDQRGTIFTEGKLCISGTGQLEVTGNKKSAIASDDYVHLISGYVTVGTAVQKGKSLYAKDLFLMGGGVLHALAEGEASKAVTTDSLITITGGKITAITTGDAIWDDDKQDYSSSTAIKCDYDMVLAGGLIEALSTGVGGKGISAGDEETTVVDGKEKTTYWGTLTIQDCDIYVRTTGKRIPEEKHEDSQGNKTEASASPKGIKASSNITINSGNIYVRCGGGNAAEGIESKKRITINDGKIRSYCIDDGMNAEGAHIYGGDIFICASDNDGFDVSYLYFYGGKLYTIGGDAAQQGLDTDGKTFVVNAGEITAVGATNSSPFTSSQQCSVMCYLKKSVAYVALADAQGNVLRSVFTPTTYNPLCVLFCCSDLQVGQSYRILSYEQDLSSTPVVEYEFTPETTVTKLGSYK